MPINLFRSNGIFSEFKNADYIPAYYFLPREIISMWGKEYRRIPRSFNALINDEKAVALVENPEFMNFLLRSYAYLIWPIMMPGIGREIYSETEPSWAFSHRLHYWIRTLTLQGVINEIEFIAERLADKYFPYPQMDEVINYLKPAVNVTMRNNDMYEVLKIAEEYRCFDDFDLRNSRQKTDFYRKWYHTRTKHPQISLEGFQEAYENSHNGQSWDVIDADIDIENDVTSDVLVHQFLSTLSEKDRKILEYRMQGYTLEEIADRLGYKNHSGVQKRIRKIGQAYEYFADVDYGFSDNKIIY